MNTNFTTTLCEISDLYQIMRDYIVVSFFTLILIACTKSEKDSQFDILENNYRNFYWSYHPEQAFNVGIHQFDDLLIIPNNLNRKTYLDGLKNYASSFDKLNKTQLSNENQAGLDSIRLQIKGEIKMLTVDKPYEWNPAYIDLETAFRKLLFSKHTALHIRNKQNSTKLKYLSPYYETMKNNLQNPPAELTRIAIQQNQSLSKFLNTDFRHNVINSKILSNKEKEYMSRQIAIVNVAINEYISFCKSCL